MSSIRAPRLSDVLQILSEQPDVAENYENASAVARSLDDRRKQIFTDAVNYCMVLLRKTDRLTNGRSDVLSDEATLMGHEMFERIINIDVQMDVESEDDTLTSAVGQRIKMESDEFFKDIVIDAYSLADEPEEASSVMSPKSTPSLKSPAQEATSRTSRKSTASLKSSAEEASSLTSRKSTASLKNSYEETSSWTSLKSSASLKRSAGETLSARPRKSTPSLTKNSGSASGVRGDLGTGSSDGRRPLWRRAKSLGPEVLPEEFDDKHLPPSPVSLAGSDDTVEVTVPKKSGWKAAVAKNLIPLEIKTRVVALSRAHPGWSLKTLQKKGSPLLRSMDQLKQWQKQIDNGGTLRDKYMQINSWTYERFVEARTRNQRVSTKMLRQWALQAARDFYDSSIKFDAGKNWCLKFKKIYGLHGGAMYGYYMKDEPSPLIEKFFGVLATRPPNRVDLNDNLDDWS